MDTQLNKLPEPKFTEKVETAGAKKPKKAVVKKHIDDYFEKDFLNSYFGKEKPSKKK